VKEPKNKRTVKQKNRKRKHPESPAKKQNISSDKPA
jgi:hypothetical protein